MDLYCQALQASADAGGVRFIFQLKFLKSHFAIKDMIKYYRAPDIEQRARNIIDGLEMKHIDPQRVVFIRSRGSAAQRTIARCHAMPRIMQTALGLDAHYIIEVIAEHFDKMPQDEQTKTLIHELLHIPAAFGGGFKFHNVVNRHNVDHMYRKLVARSGASWN